MSTYATFYLSKAQKFDVKTSTDVARDEIKVEIKTGFDNITVGLSTAQAKDVTAALQAELLPTKEAPSGSKTDRDVPF